jgi:CheY-like chemotaxis protein
VDSLGEVLAEHPRRVIGLQPGQPAYRILIVDDRPANRILMRQLLQSVGFQVREAANGQEAVAMHADWRPHLVLMDVRLPVIDGFEATKRIRATPSGQDTVIIALTATALEEERAALLAVGCDDYMRKPFRDVEFFDKLAHHLSVRYLYEQETPAGTQGTRTAVPEVLTADALADLPPEWLAALQSAAGRARSDLVMDLLKDLDDRHVQLSEGLAQLVEEFRFDEIVTLTEERKGVQS